jgi:hypothetical protein
MSRQANSDGRRRVCEMRRTEQEMERRRQREAEQRTEAIASFVPYGSELPTAFVCPQCSAIVNVRENHVDWHRSLLSASKQRIADERDEVKAEVERLRQLLADSEAEVDDRIRERNEEVRKKQAVSKMYGEALREVERLRAEIERLRAAVEVVLSPGVKYGHRAMRSDSGESEWVPDLTVLRTEEEQIAFGRACLPPADRPRRPRLTNPADLAPQSCSADGRNPVAQTDMLAEQTAEVERLRAIESSARDVIDAFDRGAFPDSQAVANSLAWLRDALTPPAGSDDANGYIPVTDPEWRFRDDWERFKLTRTYRSMVRDARSEDRMVRLGEFILRVSRRIARRNAKEGQRNV